MPMSTEAEVTLEPCPFCGDPMLIDNSDTLRHVEVGDCPIGKQGWHTAPAFIAAWNARHRASAQAAGSERAPESIDREIAGTADGLPRALRRAYVESNGNWNKVAEAALASQPATASGAPYENPDWAKEGYKSAAEEIDDMANVGRALIERIVGVTKAGPMKGWMPADCPTEIVTDLVNMLEEATTLASQQSAARPGGEEERLGLADQLETAWETQRHAANILIAPDFIEEVIAALRQSPPASEVGLSERTRDYLDHAKANLVRRKEKHPDDWQVGAYAIGFDLLEYLLTKASPDAGVERAPTASVPDVREDR